MRDGDLSPNAVTGQTHLCAAPVLGRRNRSGKRDEHHNIPPPTGDHLPRLSVISLSLQSHKAFVDAPGTDTAPEQKKSTRKDVCLCLVMTHFSGLKQESCSHVLRCTDTHAAKQNKAKTKG